MGIPYGFFAILFFIDININIVVVLDVKISRDPKGRELFVEERGNWEVRERESGELNWTHKLEPNAQSKILFQELL